jgi:hypothetical protein
MTVQQQADLGQQALRAFERDLPQLWAECPGQVVAYRGDHLLDFAVHKHELYPQCFVLTDLIPRRVVSESKAARSGR